MAKKFMFVCFGLLALAIAFHMGAQYGHAEYVDHSTSGIIAANPNGLVLLDNGEVWSVFCQASGGFWARGYAAYDVDPPVPVSEIKFWDGLTLVTTSNDWWSCDMFSETWTNCGSPPSGPTPTQPSTWGQIKAQFKE